MKLITLLTQAILTTLVSAQCSTIPFKYTPTMASGYKAQLVATGLAAPRAMVVDSTGHLLVADKGRGITRFTPDTCNNLNQKTIIVSDTTLNHGLTLSADGKTLFASTSDVVYSYSYDASTGSATNRKTLITGMNSGGHTTRSLLAGIADPDLLIVSAGSNDNWDWGCQDVNSGRCQIRGFSISQISQSPQVFRTGGLVLGWGLRNSVGLGEDAAGQLWSVENSADNIQRNNVDVHNNNPAEEFNFHGSIKDKTSRGNYGYPNCLTAWDVSVLPNNSGITVGKQFSNGTGAVSDSQCFARNPPRIALEPHIAPLDVKFDVGGTAWVSEHGSWNRSPGIGYKLVIVPFTGTQPTAANSSQAGWQAIMENQDVSKCPNSCFRPTGLAFDSQGRLWMGSDSSGEIYVITRTDGAPIGGNPSTTIRTSTTSSRISTTTSNIVTTTSRSITTTTSQSTSRAPTTTTTSSRVVTTTTSASSAQQTHWGQCGGTGFVGPATCVSPYKCTALNPYYSQCL